MNARQIALERRAMTGTDYVREPVRAMTPYTLEPRVARDKLDQNEGAFDLPDDLKRVIVERVLARRWNVYPDFEARELRDAIARRGRLTRENVLVGNGSNELLMVAMATLVAPGRRVVIPTPTFPLYEKLAMIGGGEVVRVEVDPRTGVLPLRAMLEAAGQAPSLVIACSPNNPTGGVLAPGDLNALLASGAFVLLDRAYGEFWDDGPPPPSDRLVTLSTFSKAWGLAGLRIGWLESTAELCAEMRKVKLPYNLNVFSQEAALVALENEPLMRRRVDETLHERERVSARLASIRDLEIFPSCANFVAFCVSGDADALFAGLAQRGVLIRNVSKYPGMSRCLRVSIGTIEQNDRFLDAIADALADRREPQGRRR